RRAADQGRPSTPPTPTPRGRTFSPPRRGRAASLSPVGSRSSFSSRLRSESLDATPVRPWGTNSYWRQRHFIAANVPTSSNDNLFNMSSGQGKDQGSGNPNPPPDPHKPVELDGNSNAQQFAAAIQQLQIQLGRQNAALKIYDDNQQKLNNDLNTMMTT